jgi:hypothetical protein
LGIVQSNATDFHGGNTGSNPVGDADKINNLGDETTGIRAVDVIDRSDTGRGSNGPHHQTLGTPKDFGSAGECSTPQCAADLIVGVYPYIPLG